jgi:hypothetical protein
VLNKTFVLFGGARSNARCCSLLDIALCNGNAKIYNQIVLEKRISQKIRRIIHFHHLQISLSNLELQRFPVKILKSLHQSVLHLKTTTIKKIILNCDDKSDILYITKHT